VCRSRHIRMLFARLRGIAAVTLCMQRRFGVPPRRTRPLHASPSYVRVRVPCGVPRLRR
jgi:hypothetical protein